MNDTQISLCTNCYCMTHTIDGKCGKCGARKERQKMMPQCNKNGCNRVAKVYLGKVIKDLEDEEKWEDPLYLCEKCAKRFIKKYGINKEK